MPLATTRTSTSSASGAARSSVSISNGADRTGTTAADSSGNGNDGPTGIAVDPAGAAYVVGYLETVTAYLVAPTLRPIPALLLLVLVVYVRPQGLLGRR
jgi:DNA-binding beta-propeller fold protein YncE